MTHPIVHRVRSVAADQITDRDVHAWSELEGRALEPNACLSPYFVRPAARHLALPRMPVVHFVDRCHAGHSQLIAVGVFCERQQTLRSPVRGLTSLWSEHVLGSGLLLDREWPSDALRNLLASVQRDHRYDLVELPLVWADEELVPLTGAILTEFGTTPLLEAHYDRAILRPTSCPTQLESRQLTRRVTDLDRRFRRLQELGEVTWRWHRQEGIPAASIGRFLELENMGWKAAQGTALGATAAGESFFREMVAGFASERRAFFSEMVLDSTVIASTANFISGEAGFAFKIGWDPAFRDKSPGLLNELGFMRNAHVFVGDLTFIDSGAAAGSFIGTLWPDRRPLAKLSMPLSNRVHFTVRSIDRARQVWRSAKALSTKVIPGWK